MDSHWTLDTVPTPALVIDADIVRKNIHRMAAYASEHNLSLRPHVKTHKLTRVAEMQLAAGAVGLTVAKVGEAEVMKSICDDLFIAYPALDPYRAGRIAALAQEVNLSVGIDSRLAAERLSSSRGSNSSPIGILIDLDVGFGRTGVQTPEQAVELARYVESLPGLKLKGIMYFPGNVSGPSPDQADQLVQVEAILFSAVEQFRENSLCCDVVSGGSTPAAFQSHDVPSTTEIRPGTYIYNDRNSIGFGVAEIEDCAARIYSTVISTSVPGQVVLDAGTKTLTSDKQATAPDSGHGLILEYPEAVIKKLSEEHGQVDVTACSKPPELGERVTIIPNHICPCINLQNEIWWLENGELDSWTVEARGRLV